MILYEDKNLLFSASNDGNVIAWNIKLMTIEKIFTGHTLNVNKILLDN